MKQVYDDIHMPQGFHAAGTYSGLCASRIKLDLAAVVSQAASSIVMAHDHTVQMAQGQILLLHNGTALPKGTRAEEIKTEICQAAAHTFQVHGQNIQLLANGTDGYFQPSLLKNSLPSLQYQLTLGHTQQLGAVLDNLGDLTAATVSAGMASQLTGLAADGTSEASGICLMLTDADVSMQQLAEAWHQCCHAIDTEDFTFIAMANGTSGESLNAHDIAKAMETAFKQLGFSQALQACC